MSVLDDVLNDAAEFAIALIPEIIARSDEDGHRLFKTWEAGIAPFAPIHDKSGKDNARGYPSFGIDVPDAKRYYAHGAYDPGDPPLFPYKYALFLDRGCAAYLQSGGKNFLTVADMPSANDELMAVDYVNYPFARLHKRTEENVRLYGHNDYAENDVRDFSGKGRNVGSTEIDYARSNKAHRRLRFSTNVGNGEDADIVNTPRNAKRPIRRYWIMNDEGKLMSVMAPSIYVVVNEVRQKKVEDERGNFTYVEDVVPYHLAYHTGYPETDYIGIALRSSARQNRDKIWSAILEEAGL